MSGPEPKYRPRFTQEEIAQARRLARRLKAPSAEVQRAKMVLVLLETPKITNAALARRIGIHINTVRKWRKRWSTQGLSLEDEPRSGRPPVFSP